MVEKGQQMKMRPLTSVLFFFVPCLDTSEK
jgi:hypothetical protein